MTKKKTTKEFKKQVKELVGNDYVVLGNYVNSASKILIKHLLCGNCYEVTPNNFIRGRRCPYCKNRKTTASFSEEVKNKSNGKILFIGEYKGVYEKALFHCIKHNRDFLMTPSSFLQGNYWCKKCKYEQIRKAQRKTEKYFESELYQKHNGTIKCCEKYVNTHKKIKFQCLICKNYFYAEPNSVLRLSGCPYCARSHGEDYVSEYLLERGINFETQKKFSGCFYKRQLPFDFYLPDFNVLIEYDGVQHSHPIDFFGGEKGFKAQNKRDTIKNDYAIKNNIHLLRIMYCPKEEEVYEALDLYFSGSSSNKIVVVN